MEALRSSKISQHLSTTGCRNTNGYHLINNHCENLKTYNLPLCWILCHFALMCSIVMYYFATCNFHFLQELGWGIFHVNSIPAHSLLVFWRQSYITQSGGHITIVSFPTWTPRFNAKAVHVGFVVDNVAAFSMHMSNFSCQLSFHHCSILIYQRLAEQVAVSRDSKSHPSTKILEKMGNVCIALTVVVHLLPHCIWCCNSWLLTVDVTSTTLMNEF